MAETGRAPRVLLVEDDTDIQAVVRLSLEKVGGFSLQVCGSGGEVVEAAAAFRPDLVLLDVLLPDMDGMEVFTALRDDPRTAGTPAVFLTSRAQPQEVRSYFEMGAVDVIAKPFDAMTLPGRVRQILDRLGD